MQVGGPGQQPKTWTEAQVIEALAHMQTIEDSQISIEAQINQVPIADAAILLMVSALFGYLVIGSFLPTSICL